MGILVFLSIMTAALAVLFSWYRIRRVKEQIAEIADALADVKNGNGGRRILSAANELAAPLPMEINEIVVSYERRLSAVRQAEEAKPSAYDQPFPMMSGHPLTTLIGYLDAAHKDF